MFFLLSFLWIKNVKGKDMLSQREYKILIMLSFRRFECVSMLYAVNLWYVISIFELEKACFSWNREFYSIFKGAKMTVIRKKLENFFKILFWGLTRRIDIFGVDWVFKYCRCCIFENMIDSLASVYSSFFMFTHSLQYMHVHIYIYIVFYWPSFDPILIVMPGDEKYIYSFFYLPMYATQL